MISVTKVLSSANVEAVQQGKVVFVRCDFPAQSNTGWVRVATGLPLTSFQAIARGVGAGGGAVNSWMAVNGTELEVLVQPNEINIQMAFTLTYIAS